jgi:hypothetical protein
MENNTVFRTSVSSELRLGRIWQGRKMREAKKVKKQKTNTLQATVPAAATDAHGPIDDPQLRPNTSL